MTRRLPCLALLACLEIAATVAAQTPPAGPSRYLPQRPAPAGQTAQSQLPQQPSRTYGPQPIGPQPTVRQAQGPAPQQPIRQAAGQQPIRPPMGGAGLPPAPAPVAAG